MAGKTYDHLPTVEYSFDLLDTGKRKQMLEERKARYEAMLFDNIMNQKAEALSRNPQRSRAIHQLGDEAAYLKECIEMVDFEMHMLDVAELAEDAATTDDLLDQDNEKSWHQEQDEE